MKKSKRTIRGPSMRSVDRTGHTAGLSTGKLTKSGALTLRLDVNGHKGSLWLSQDMWEAIGGRAGWPTPPAELKEPTMSDVARLFHAASWTVELQASPLRFVAKPQPPKPAPKKKARRR